MDYKQSTILLNTVLKPFLSKQQFSVLAEFSRTSEEAQFFIDKIGELANTITNMRATNDEGATDIVHLHYFFGGADWWITEKDVDGGVDQAFGLARLFPGGEELGYISIAQLTECGAELDFHWKPRTVAEVQRKLR